VAGLALPLGGHAEAPPDDLRAIAEEAYVYAYPLMVMDATERTATNVPAPKGVHAPLNQFARVDVLPDASFTAVVMPNVDTLYTSAWLDLKKEPMVLHVPDTHDRYYLMPMLDAYTNVFASPGKRTSGTRAQDIAIVGPGWKGTLPAGVTRIDAPTNLVWLLGRTEIKGKDDLPAVVALTNQYTLTPLSSYGRPYTPPRNDSIDKRLDEKTPPPKMVAAMDAEAYFTRAAALMKQQPPPERDRAALARFEKIGFGPGRFLPSPNAKEAIAGTPDRTLPKIEAHFATIGKNVNGWRYDTKLGSYDTRYLDRATVALFGLGANLGQDALYPAAKLDAVGAPLNGGSRYIVHFAKGKAPPVNAFWSITMYTSEGYLVANPINRFAVGDRDKLVRNKDGSLDLLIQHDRPEGATAANWLPAPDGPFTLTMRMYWPKAPALDGKWLPPPIKKAGAVASVPRPKM
jgi:hypothetical protein